MTREKKKTRSESRLAVLDAATTGVRQATWLVAPVF